MKRNILIAVLTAFAIILGSAGIAEDTATAVVEGIGEHVTVTLTMEDGNITRVEASSDNTEADERGRECLKMLADAMVEQNSLHVDVVSGATGTSNAVIAAAIEAWLQIKTVEASQEAWMQPACEVLAIYSCPNTQIISNSDNSVELADTVIYLFTDFTYTQYIDHDHRYEVYSEGTFDLNFDWKEKGWQYVDPHVITIHVQKLRQADQQMAAADMTYEVNLDVAGDYCLYPDNARSDLKLVAAFMQVDKQRLVRADGIETYLPTMWFYYDDGTFEQYALYYNKENVLFSTGDYALSGGEFDDSEAVLTLHRTHKYQDGVGLTEYESTHDYDFGNLGFVRVYPRVKAG